MTDNKNDAFTQQLIDKLKIQDLPAENQQALLDKIETAANLRFANSLTELLTEDQLAEAEKLQAAGKTDEQVVEWIQTQLPNYDEILRAIILDLADEVIGKQ